MVFVLILIVVVVLVIVVIGTRNGLVRVRNRVENAWAQIDVQLKRRSDLVPNLVETVKAYAAHERETLDAVVQARNASISAASPAAAGAADTQLTGALTKLFALSDAYPDLKANQNFLALQEELTATEDKVGYARQAYNDAVTTYNTKIQQIPGSLFAGGMGYKPREYYQVDEVSKVAPKVQF